MSYISVSHLGPEHLEWLKSIEFYESEFDILETRLAEIVSKNNGPEAMAGVEHFQNQFLIQRNNMNELKHAIHEHTGRVSEDAKKHMGKMEAAAVGDHTQLQDRFQTLEKIINDLRQEFNRYLAKWM